MLAYLRCMHSSTYSPTAKKKCAGELMASPPEEVKRKTVALKALRSGAEVEGIASAIGTTEAGRTV
jgi:hypothetical protein